MRGLAPFAYPSSVHMRKHAPAGYEDYRSYKPWLRDEFTFRCVYCLERERWYPSRAAAFSVDHVVPQVVARDRICEYANLVYACVRCNSNKRDELFPATSQTPLAKHLAIDHDAIFSPVSARGYDFIRVFHLNDAPIIDTRRKHISILKLKHENPDDPLVHEIFLDAFGYPDDLPDLASMRPPGGRKRTKSVRTLSYYDLRRLNKLEAVY